MIKRGPIYWLAMASVIVMTAVAITFILSGCGEDKFQTDKIGSGYYEAEIPYHNSFVKCIGKNSDTKDGYTVRSISCDFVEYHKRVGDVR